MKNLHKYFVVSVLLLLVAVGYVFFYRGAASTRTYSDKSISFEYPAELSVKREGESVTIHHSVTYSGPNMCDFVGDAPPLDKLSDFNISIKVVDQGIRAYLEANGFPSWDYVSQNPYSFGSFRGYSATVGVEGCGSTVYYLSVTPDKTIVVTRPLIPEFALTSEIDQKYKNIPGIILPSKAEAYFALILSTLAVQ